MRGLRRNAPEMRASGRVKQRAGATPDFVRLRRPKSFRRSCRRTWVAPARCQSQKFDQEKRMKSFIPRQQKIKEEAITIRLDCEVIDDLKLYAEYLESSQNYVVCQVLRKAFRKDKDFAAWRTERDSADEIAASKPSRTRSKEPATPKREATVA